jgi:DNA polymerase
VDIYHVAYDEVTKKQRQVSKSACLGNMYGAGAKGLQGYFEGYGLTLELDEAQRLVNLYRNKHAGIKKAWYAFGNAALQAVANKGVVFETNRCKLMFDGRFLRLKLPSSRVISWYHPKVESVLAPWGDWVDAVTYIGKPRQGKTWVRQQLIGSSIFQSVVQGTARDILVNAVIKLEEFGAPAVLTIHDQVICEVDEDWNEVDEFKRIMTTPPSWGLEIPLDVEGGVLYNYIKD